MTAIREAIKDYVAERRIPHVYGTEAECARLADLFGLTQEDKERLRLSALLHDITKRWSREEHCRYAAEHRCLLDEETLRGDKTLHAVTGAHLAKALYPSLVDEGMVTAIRFHTTGRAGMSLFEKLLYLADYIEPTRTFPDCVRLRSCFYERIDAGEEPLAVLDDILLLSFDMTMTDLLRERQPIHRDTVAARNALLVREER